MGNQTETINRILATWNPLSVSENVAMEEYKIYVPKIIKLLHNRELLIDYLEEILISEMESDYNPKDFKHREDVEKVCDLILKTD